jgi:hypothetical protein
MFRSAFPTASASQCSHPLVPAELLERRCPCSSSAHHHRHLLLLPFCRLYRQEPVRRDLSRPIRLWIPSLPCPLSPSTTLALLSLPPSTPQADSTSRSPSRCASGPPSSAPSALGLLDVVDPFSMAPHYAPSAPPLARRVIASPTPAARVIPPTPSVRAPELITHRRRTSACCEVGEEPPAVGS